MFPTVDEFPGKSDLGSAISGLQAEKRSFLWRHSICWVEQPHRGLMTYAKRGGSHGNPVQVLQVLEDGWDAGQMLQCPDDAGELG